MYRREQQAMALLFTLAVGVVLILLAVSLFTLYSSDVHSQSQQHQAIQAYWLARAGVERYSDTRQLPGSDYHFATEISISWAAGNPKSAGAGIQRVLRNSGFTTQLDSMAGAATRVITRRRL